jgi:hypothetical protein
MSEKRGHTGKTKPLRRKERSNSLCGKFGKGSLDDIRGTECLIRNFLGITTNLIENIDGKPGFGSVLECNRMHGSNRIFLQSSREQKLGRFVKME